MKCKFSVVRCKIENCSTFESWAQASFSRIKTCQRTTDSSPFPFSFFFSCSQRFWFTFFCHDEDSKHTSLDPQILQDQRENPFFHRYHLFHWFKGRPPQAEFVCWYSEKMLLCWHATRFWLGEQSNQPSLMSQHVSPLSARWATNCFDQNQCGFYFSFLLLPLPLYLRPSIL